MNLAILGPQGSGKGTQAEKLAEKYGLLHIETGRILRDIVKSDSPMGSQIREIMNGGQLVSDKILTQVLSEHITSDGIKEGIIFDGTPRDLDQYEVIKKLLGNLGGKLDKVIYLKISNEESIKRLSNRRTCQNCGEVYNLLTNPPREEGKCDMCGATLVQREDDKPEIIAKRLAKFAEATTPVINQAREEGILQEIDGERPIEVIFEDIVSRLQL